MRIKEIMTARSLKSCGPETSLQGAAKIMRSANIGALPVIDKKKKVVGLVTDRDIALALAKPNLRQAAKLEVKKVMTSNVHTVSEDEDVSAALNQMRINKVGRVPVVDEEGKLQGIVSMHNLLNQATKEESGVELGTLTADGENLVKTIMAITDRYSNGSTRKAK